MNRNTNRFVLPAIYYGLACLSFVLTSPKWTIALASWLAPLFLLLAIRRSRPLIGFFLAYVVLTTSSMIGGYGVVPLPFAPFVIVTLIGGFLGYIPYAIHQMATRSWQGFWATLVFPAAAVTLDYLMSFGPQGVWSSSANTQYSFLLLLQLTSITGLWGITFLLSWFASVGSYVIDHWQDRRREATRAAMVFSGTMCLVLGFGAVRLVRAPRDLPTVMIAGISTENSSVMVTAHRIDAGESLVLPSRISQSDPRLAEIMISFQHFVEDPENERFRRVHTEIQAVEDRLFASSRKAVEDGAKIIVWSEGITMRIKPEEQSLIDRGRAFAKEHRVYFLVSFAALRPGKITPGRKFLENKVLTISPAGDIINTFFKNVPVSTVEPSVPGDGVIPLITTEYGKLSPSICYDADFPRHMRQAGINGTEILLLPAGDWSDIAPYHSYMAMIRGIENGCAVFRPVSHGRSMATDAYGRTLAMHDFFDDPDGILLAQVPIQNATTLYSHFGDFFAWTCEAFLFVTLILTVVNRFRRRANWPDDAQQKLTPSPRA